VSKFSQPLLVRLFFCECQSHFSSWNLFTCFVNIAKTIFRSRLFGGNFYVY